MKTGSAASARNAAADAHVGPASDDLSSLGDPDGLALGILPILERRPLGGLGNGTTTEAHAPFTVPGLAGVNEFVAGYAHTCARSGGVVRCWGEDLFGQGGVPSEQHTPVVVPGLPSSATQVASGRDHVCAAFASSAVYCWGRNNHGQLGDNTLAGRYTPALVALP